MFFLVFRAGARSREQRPDPVKTTVFTVWNGRGADDVQASYMHYIACGPLRKAFLTLGASSALLQRLRRPFWRGFWPLLAVSWQALGCSWPSLGRSWPPQAAPGTALWSLFACVMPLWRFSSLAGPPLTSIWRLLGPAPAGFSVRPALFWRTLWDPVAGWRCTCLPTPF